MARTTWLEIPSLVSWSTKMKGKIWSGSRSILKLLLENTGAKNAHCSLEKQVPFHGAPRSHIEAIMLREDIARHRQSFVFEVLPSGRLHHSSKIRAAEMASENNCENPFRGQENEVEEAFIP